MKYAGWILSLILLAAVLILWKCPAEPVNSKVAELEKQLAESEARFKVKDDSTRRIVLERDLIIAGLTEEKEILSGELKVVGDQVKDLVFRVRHARVVRDTFEFYLSCDSLAIAAVAQSELIETFQHTSDSLLVMFNDQLEAKDSMIVARDRLLSQVRGAFNVAADENRNLIKLYEKEKKKHKLAKNASIVLGAAVIILGGILIGN